MTTNYAMALLRRLLSICLMDRGGLDQGICVQPTIHTLLYSLIELLLCFNLCMIPSVHITSITPVHPGEGSSSVAHLKVSSLFLSEGLF